MLPLLGIWEGLNVQRILPNCAKSRALLGRLGYQALQSSLRGFDGHWGWRSLHCSRENKWTSVSEELNVKGTPGQHAVFAATGLIIQFQLVWPTFFTQSCCQLSKLRREVTLCPGDSMHQPGRRMLGLRVAPRESERDKTRGDVSRLLDRRQLIITNLHVMVDNSLQDAR